MLKFPHISETDELRRTIGKTHNFKSLFSVILKTRVNNFLLFKERKKKFKSLDWVVGCCFLFYKHP